MKNLDILNVISFAVGIFGIFLSIYFGIENRKLAQKVRTYSWSDIDVGMKHFTEEIEKRYSPDLIVSSSGGSVGVVANLYLTNTDRFIPTYVGVSKSRLGEFTSVPIYSERYTTVRWETFIPADLPSAGAERVLVLEDVVISGESKQRLIDSLTAQGIPRENIKTAALFVTEHAITIGQAPDYYWYTSENPDFYLPWGLSTGKRGRADNGA
ncbi:hypothetical protein [Skermania piniformis]|uniref:Phosphoribosyltransferase domain-containing protein n=1 Tax=Skermania pinensis TaxID=39122 RepID=A0ABX8S3F0_9ACTN|nr:hypothetical protein [Skermania piniformis]QXQ12352.1 hypothetical protein KV203_10085 [Skermania piniformis]